MKEHRKLHGHHSYHFQLNLFIFLLLLTTVLGFASVAKTQGNLIPQASVASAIVDNTVHLDKMNLEDKIAQMIVVHGSENNKEIWKKMNIGAFHLFAMESEELYRERIQGYQENMSIPFFVTTDLEGCQNSFANFKNFTPNDQITTMNQAREKGLEEGAFLRNLGFSINFAPVVDLDDSIWGCRSFPGGEEEVAKLSLAYIEALQSQGVSATSKHYPGKTLVISDPHQNLVAASIDSQDVFPYEEQLEADGDSLVDFLMVSHIIVNGEVNSSGLPSSVSPEVILPLKENYEGIIISDDILMRGLQDFYENDSDQLYIDLVLAGHDMIINFDEDPNEIYYMIQVITKAVDAGVIEEAQIDASVTKILELKGFGVKS